MTRLLFTHEGPVRFDGERYYGYGYNGLYERYSYLADEVIFCMRVEPLTEGTTYSALPPQIKVVEIPDFKSPIKLIRSKGRAERIIAEQVKLADVIVARTSECSNMAVKYATRMGKPVIYECVSCVWDGYWNHGMLGKLAAPVSFIKTRHSVSQSRYVHYVTSEFLQRRYPSSGVQCACSDVRLTPAEKPDLIQKRNRLAMLRDGNGTVILGTAGAVDVKYKGQDLVIRALPLLEQRGITCEYHLAGGNRRGDTRLEDLAKKLGVQERVVFHGALDRSAMKDFYSHVDVYVQPSKQEGLPRAVIEAMGNGCPAIGARTGGIPELLEEDELFDKGSINGFVSRLCDILKRDLTEVSQSNYVKALDYRPEVLDSRLRCFYDEFKHDVGLAV